jgi:predicted phosphodiesterase
VWRVIVERGTGTLDLVTATDGGGGILESERWHPMDLPIAGPVRVAALYDIHGNVPALEAVLREVEREAPEMIVVGDDIALGPMPAETLERLIALRGRAQFIRGNTDRELVDRYDGTSSLREAVGEDNVWIRRGEWAAQQITRAQRNFLASLPTTVVVDVEGLGPTLFCHGSPRSDEEPITRLTPGTRLDEMLAGVAENVIVCGHSHVQFDRTHKGKRVVNAGSVGMHSEGRPGAYWVLLGPDVDPRRTTYDIEGASKRLRATGYPDLNELVERLTAEDSSIAEEASALFETAATKPPPWPTGDELPPG